MVYDFSKVAEYGSLTIAKVCLPPHSTRLTYKCARESTRVGNVHLVIGLLYPVISPRPS